MNEHKKIYLAKRQVAAIKGFYIHLAVFVLVIALLLAINMATGPLWWVQWPFLGWGVGVIGHAFAVFGRAPGTASRSPGIVARWEQRKIAELTRRLDEAEPKATEAPKASGSTVMDRPGIDRPAI